MQSGSVGEGKTRGHHTNHAIRPCIQQQFFPRHAGVGSEPGLPERVADHGDLFPSRLIIRWPNNAAQLRPNAQLLEKLAGHTRAGNANGRAIHGEIGTAGGEQGETVK
jgi:hypothetical protein